MAQIKIVHGPPLGGKTTYVWSQIKEGDIVWDYDAAFSALTFRAQHTEPTDPQHKLVLGTRAHFLRVCRHSDAGTAWIITTRITDAIKDAAGDDAEYIKVDPGRDECLARLEADDTRPDKERERAQIEKYYKEECRMAKLTDRQLARMDGEREYRTMTMQAREAGTDGSMIVEGYATTFGAPYVLYDSPDYRVLERVAPEAFDGCDMSDVIMQYDHEGRVFARNRNGTLTLSADDVGLKVSADLSGTDIGRQLYQEIKGGYTDKMSFGFVVAEDKRESVMDHENDVETMTRTITKIKKLYDVSAVSIPANDMTSISARRFADGVICEIKAERLERAKKKLNLMLEV